jgi:hypothetical protein
VKIIAANNMSDRITVLKGMAEQQVIPEKADIIVSEWMGYCLLYEWMVRGICKQRPIVTSTMTTHYSLIQC